VAEGYSLTEVSRLTALPRASITRLIQSGVVRPTRGARGEYRFGFADLVVLRTAKSLADASVPAARITRSLRRLQAQLPASVPISGLRVEVVGDAVVVSEGDAQWRPDDGQLILRFGVEPTRGGVAFIEPAKPTPKREPEIDWYERALALDTHDPAAACEAYRKALQADAKHLDAYVNLGLALHRLGDLEQAEAVYRSGLAQCGADSLLLFDLAVLLEDRKRYDDALDAYRAAVKAAPDFADAHYNLAMLCRERGLPQEAIRHLSAYKKLTA
jgi:tetratricopeptide (TPR) repeat protein